MTRVAFILAKSLTAFLLIPDVASVMANTLSVRSFGELNLLTINLLLIIILLDFQDLTQ